MKAQLSVAAAFWSLLWRSVLLLPLASLFLVIFFGLWVGVVLLPIAGIFFLYQREWGQAALTFALWIVLLILTRWKIFKAARKDFPNEQENV